MTYGLSIYMYDLKSNINRETSRDKIYLNSMIRTIQNLIYSLTNRQ